MDLGELLYEKEAEEAFSREGEIEDAARWCKAKYPHRFQFLNEIYKLLTAEEQHLKKLGFGTSIKTGAVRLQPVLTILTPSQALRLLESFKRATANDRDIWKAKDIKKIEALESDKKRDEIVNKVKEALRKRNNDT